MYNKYPLDFSFTSQSPFVLWWTGNFQTFVLYSLFRIKRQGIFNTTTVMKELILCISSNLYFCKIMGLLSIFEKGNTSNDKDVETSELDESVDL